MIWLPAAAFSALGLLIGSLAGLTVSPVVVTLIAALFAFVGGSAVAFIGKLDPTQLRLASVAVLSLSIFMLVGLVGGLLVKSNSWLILDPADRASANAIVRKEGNFVLRDQYASTRDDLKGSLRAGDISLEEACHRLADAAKQPGR